LAAERVAVIGAGIGGLALALALKDSGREVVIVERDPEPPEIPPAEAFDSWLRPGVPQFRHAHVFLARVQTLLRDRHPQLWDELRTAGLELSRLTDSFPARHAEGFEPAAGDEDLRHFWGRRPTFEYVLRRHVGRLAHVRFIHSARVTGFVTEADAGKLRVRGLELTQGGGREMVEAEIVVDASGKHTKSPEWLQALGVSVAVDNRPSGFVYACRHYRLLRPLPASLRREMGGTLDFLAYATMWAEQGSYALTLVCPVEDKELGEAIRRAEGFEALCDQLPALQPWRTQSAVTSKVYGAGLFENRWIRYGTAPGHDLSGFFAVGDSYMETNPMYGRGCSSAFVQAHVLARVLDETADPRARAALYQERTHALLYHYFNLSVDTDHMCVIKAKLSQGQPTRLRDRVLSYLYDAAWLGANQDSLLVAREYLKAQQMREVSSVGMRLRMMLHMLRAFVWTVLGRARPQLAPPGPPRAELLRTAAARQEPHPPLPPPG